MSISRFVILYNDFIGGQIMRLADLREDNDLTQSYIAEILHIKQNTYSQYETGHRQIPIDILITLADFYNTSVDYILCRTNNPTPYQDIKNNNNN